MQVNSLQSFSMFSKFRILSVLKTDIRHYAKPGAGGIPSLGGKKGKLAKGPTLEKKIMPVVEDTERLVNYVCGSCIYTEGEDIKIKDDSEYPDWLWKLHLGKPKTLSELDPESDEYWEQLLLQDMIRRKRLLKIRKF